MNPELLFQPLRLGQQTFPGIWRAMMPPDFQQLRFPDEKQAACMNCPKACYEDWRPDYRCCTYHPRIPNFLLGLASRTPQGKTAVDDLLQRGMILPEGMHSSPRQWLDFVDDEHADLFGKSQKVLCPMLDPASGHCRVHVFRNAVCSTYFCDKEQGHAGEVFWSQIQTLGSQLEMRLGQWALREIGFDLEASLRALDELAPDLAQVSGKEGWQTEALQRIWGAYAGREMELLNACADVILKNRDQLWSIAQQQRIAEPHEFDAALLREVPDEQQDIMEESDEEWTEIVDLDALWEDCLAAHQALWEKPSGLFTLSPQVAFVPNDDQTPEERYHRAQPFFLEFRFQNPERSLYFRLALSREEKDCLAAFAGSYQPLPQVDARTQDFLQTMIHRHVLRAQGPAT
jgi:Fe-S-cluster containining protein